MCKLWSSCLLQSFKWITQLATGISCTNFLAIWITYSYIFVYIESKINSTIVHIIDKQLLPIGINAQIVYLNQFLYFTPKCVHKYIKHKKFSFEVRNKLHTNCIYLPNLKTYCCLLLLSLSHNGSIMGHVTRLLVLAMCKNKFKHSL